MKITQLSSFTIISCAVISFDTPTRKNQGSSDRGFGNRSVELAILIGMAQSICPGVYFGSFTITGYLYRMVLVLEGFNGLNFKIN
jgi:hypothetical protein